MMRRSLIGLTVLILSGCLLLLSACQRGSDAPSDVIHLTLWHGVNPPANREVLQGLVDRFNITHPPIQVESFYVGQGDQQIPKILTAIVGDVPPNLLWYAPTITGQLVDLDAIVPVEDWLKTLPVKDQIDPALFATMTFEDHQWSIPFSVNNVGLFYRPSLLAAAGITDLPQTWQDLRQVAQKLTDRATGRYGLLMPLGKGEWTVFMWLPFLWSAGGDLTQDIAPDIAVQNSKFYLVNQGAIAALQFWQDLVKDGSAILSQPERGYELEQFLSGKVAMQLTGPWTLGQLQSTGVDYAVMPIPRQIQPATSLGGENLFLFHATPREEQAAQVFAAYVLSEEFQTDWAIATGYLPVNLKSRQSVAYQQFLAQNPALQVFLDQAADGRSRPISPGYNRLSDALGRAIEAVLLGKETPETALEKAQQRIDRFVPR